MSRWRTVGNTASDLTDSEIEPQPRETRCRLTHWLVLILLNKSFQNIQDGAQLDSFLQTRPEPLKLLWSYIQSQLSQVFSTVGVRSGIAQSWVDGAYCLR